MGRPGRDGSRAAGMGPGRVAGSWHAPGDAHAVLAAYTAVTGTAIPPPDRLAPLRPLRDLEAAVWSVCMARQYPTRYREVAAQLLGQVLAGPG